MKKILTTLLIAVLWSNTIYANIKNIGNGISIKLPNGYHYFDITLKQIVSRFPSIDISDFTNSEFGIGPNAKLVILANDKKTIKLANDISTVSGLVKLTEDYWEPFLSLEEDPVFMKIIKSYAKKNFSKIDLDNASDEEWQIIFITVFNDKKFLKKIDQYIRPFIDKFKSDYEFDKITLIFIGDKKLEFVNELKKLSISEAKNLLSEGIKTMSKEDPALKIYKDFKYKIGKNSKGNLYLYSNDISYLDSDPLFKQLKYIKKSDTILTTDNEKLVTISSQCIKKCNSTDFLQIIGPTNLYKGFANNQIKTPIIKNNSDIVFQLKKLNDLYKSGSLTKDEFNKAKKKLLN